MPLTFLRDLLRHKRWLAAAVGVIAAMSVTAGLRAYATYGHKWGTSQVLYYVNPSSRWLSQSAAIYAVQSAAGVWHEQSSANIQLVYAGTTSGSSLTLNNKNEVFFRNDANGGVIAETYWWWNGSGQLVDADIVFHEGGFQFFAVSGCTNGVYAEDVGAHEFGHVLGLDHSSEPGATMAPSIPSMCDMTLMQLEADDIAGIESLYPPAQSPAGPSQLSAAASATNPSTAITLSWADNANNETQYLVERSNDGSSFTQIAQLSSNIQSYISGNLAAGATYWYRVRAGNNSGVSPYSNTASRQTQVSAGPNTAPTVTILTPYANSLYPAGAATSFSGTSVDGQDGTMSNTLVWTSSLDGQLGIGSDFSKTLSSGTHLITASSTDGGGLVGSSSVTVTVGAGSVPTNRSLAARGYKKRAAQQVDLTWNGFVSTTIDIYRNGVRVMTTPNDRSQTDAINSKGGGSYSYKACEAGSTTCSASVTVTF